MGHSRIMFIRAIQLFKLFQFNTVKKQYVGTIFEKLFLKARMLQKFTFLKQLRLSNKIASKIINLANNLKFIYLLTY